MKRISNLNRGFIAVLLTEFVLGYLGDIKRICRRPGLSLQQRKKLVLAAVGRHAGLVCERIEDKIGRPVDAKSLARECRQAVLASWAKRKKKRS